MMRKLKFLFLVLVSSFTAHYSYSQLVVNVGQTATQYAQQLVGSGVTVSNAQFQGAQGGGGAYVQNTGGYNSNANVQQIGSFSNGGTTNLGLGSGITLSSGEVRNSELPDQTSTGQYPSGYPSYTNSYDNDPDLNALTSSTSYNCAVLEFDFVPVGPHVSFSYVFASSEYPGWVGSSYNDVFGFFLSGPGISGPYSNSSVNIATIPSTSTPVSINTVNGGTGSNGGCPSGSGSNAQYYVDNCNGTVFPFHGFTTVLTAEYDVQCGQTYHIKIAVGDVDDVNWDSAIFLKKNSLNSAMLTVNPDTTTICPGGSATLTSTLTNDDGTGSYSWLPDGQTTPNITVSPSTSTQYVVEYNKNGCVLKDTAEVIVGGQATLQNVTPGPCSSGTYDITGNVNVTNPPSSGDLVVEDCNGNQTVIASAPFTQSSYPFTLSGLNADGNSCSLSTYFSISPNCDDSQTITAPAPCSSSCIISNLTATIGACDPATSSFDLTGTVEFSNAPTTGQLIVEDCNGNQQTFNAPFTSPINYSITGIDADGANCSVTAHFSADASCTSSMNYTNPTPCTNPCHFDSLVSTIASCNAATNTFDITGHVVFNNAPTTGQLIVEDCNGNQQTFNAPFTSPQNFSITGINADGASCGLTAHFTADPSCTININYDNPADCSCIVDAGNFDVNIYGSGQSTAGVNRICYGDTFSITGAGGFIPPNDVGPGQGYSYNPAIGYLAYSCPPSVFPPNDLLTDPCFIGVVQYSGPNGGIFGINTTGNPPNFGVPLTDNTIYFVPITMYDTISGTYAVNSNGIYCYDMANPIAVQYLPEVTSSNPTENCQDGTFEVTISGGLPAIDGSNFTASNLVPATASFDNTTCADGGTIKISGLQDGDMYSFDVTDGNGCPVTISGGPFVGLPTANAGQDDTAACGALTYTLAAIPSVGTGTWTGTGGVTFSDSQSPTATVTVPSAGNYTLTWTEDNGNGCTNADDVVITFFANPTYTSSTTDATCGNTDGSITLTTTSGASPFTYSIDGGNTSQNNGSFTGLGQNNYSILITDDNGCQVTGNEMINESGAPTIDNVTPTDASCHNVCDGQIQVTMSGGTTPYTYAWTDANNNAVGTNANTINGLCDGSYNLTVTDGNNCSVSHNNIVVSEPAAIDSSFALTDYCEGTTNAATNIATPGGTFSFNPAPTDGATINAGTGAISNGQGGTTYTVQYEVTVGTCSSTGTQTVTVNSNPNYSAAVTDATCDNDNGEIVLSAVEGLTPYQYSIDGGTTSQSTGTFSSLSAGNYAIQVTDANLCKVTGNESIAQVGSPSITSINSTNPSCNGLCDGGATVVATSGGAPYTYAWTDANTNTVGTTDQATGLCDGNYTVTVTDTNGCVVSGTATLTEPQPVDPSFSVSDFCKGDNNAASNIATPGGTFSFNPAVTDGATIDPTTGTITDGVGGTTYTVQYEANVGGCSATATHDVTVSPVPNPDFMGDDLSGCAPHTVNFTDNSTGTGNNASCIWDFGDGTTVDNCTGNVSHTYTDEGLFTVSLSITTQNGCKGNNTVANYIEITPHPKADFSADPMEVGITNPEVNFTNHSENATDYTWTFGDDSPSESTLNVSHTYPNDKGGNYTVTLIASNGEAICNDTISMAIKVKEQVIYYVPNTFTPDGDDFNETFLPIFTAGFDPYSYTLLIFNRWGEIVFESHNTAIGWDGTYGGKIVPDGTYVWKITFKEADSMSDRHHTVVGSVNVLR